MDWDNFELGVWIEDLIWCPSQCYYYFKIDNQDYCIYLRWRYRDPWTAELITRGEDKDSWESIPIEGVYNEKDYKALEMAAISALRGRFPNLPNPYKTNIEILDTTVKITNEDIEEWLKNLKK